MAMPEFEREQILHERAETRQKLLEKREIERKLNQSQRSQELRRSTSTLTTLHS
jgi:hypothetical protein